MPITSYDGVKRMTTLSRRGAARGPRARARRAQGRPEAIAELGVSYATLQSAELLAGGAPGSTSSR
jgi:methylenetetrahydrofolate reductase (NADPH)